MPSSPLAPVPGIPERGRPEYTSKTGANSARKGRLRFEEGIGTDTDVPRDFGVGVLSGYETAPGRPNHNKQVWIKPPAETLQERAHVGSAAWPEGPKFLGSFVDGAGSGAELKFQAAVRDGGHQNRPNYARISDSNK